MANSQIILDSTYFQRIILWWWLSC